MKRTISILLVSLLTVVYTVPAFGWGQEGHRIIAKIAYDNMTRKARKSVDRIEEGERRKYEGGSMKEEGRMKEKGGRRELKEGIIYWANWPDEIKSDTIYPTSYDWHFQDFDGGMSDSAVVAALTDYPKEGGNLFKALDSLVTVLRTDRKQTASLTEDRLIQLEHTLRFIVHLSGDRYCPMHMAHMDDKGGNAVKMKWFGGNTNLHTVWDTKLIESQGYSYTEYAQKLEREYAWKKKEIEKMSDAELLLMSYHKTEAIYAYQATWDGNAYHYIYRWRQPMEEQLYIAGIRLAQLLNAIFK